MPTLPVGPFSFPGTPPTPPEPPATPPEPPATPPAANKPPVGVSPTGKPVTAGLAGHKPYPAPVPPRVIATASALLPKMPMGGVAVDSDPAGRYSVVRYRKEPHGHGKVGITAYVPFAEKASPGIVDQTVSLFERGADNMVKSPGRLWEAARRAAGRTPDPTVTGYTDRWNAADLSGSNYDPRGWYRVPEPEE